MCVLRGWVCMCVCYMCVCVCVCVCALCGCMCVCVCVCVCVCEVTIPNKVCPQRVDSGQSPDMEVRLAIEQTVMDHLAVILAGWGSRWHYHTHKMPNMSYAGLTRQALTA